MRTPRSSSGSTDRPDETDHLNDPATGDVGARTPRTPRAGAPDTVDPGPARVVIGAAGLLACLPVVAAVIAWRDGWMPTSDWASVVIRSYDTFSSDPPLVGIYSSATTTGGGGPRNVYHPGPLQEWLLAIPTHVFAPSTFGVLLGSALLVSLCVATVVFVAWRRGGPMTAAVATIGTALFMTATGPAMLREPLHTPLATFAMAAFLAAAWAVLDDDVWFWPVLIFFGSLAGQAQVAFLVPVGIVSVTVVVAVGWFRQRADGIPPTEDDAGSRRRHRRVVATTVLVAIACWGAPLYDQFVGEGNLWALFTTGSSGEPIGPGWAMTELTKTLAIPPSWIDHGLHLSVTIVGDSHVVWHTGFAEGATAAVTIAVVAWGLLRAFRDGRSTRIGLGVVAVAALLGCFVASWIMPDEAFSLLGHREIWRSAGLFTWWFVLVTLADALRPVAGRIAAIPDKWGPRFVAAGTVVVVGFTMSWTIADASPAHDSGSSGFGAVESFTAVATPLCAQGPIALQPTTLVDAPTTLGLAAMLTLRGCEVHVEDLSEILPGSLHRPTGTEAVLLTIDGFDIVPDGCQRIAVYDPNDPPERYRGFTDTLDRLQRAGPLYLFACPR